MENISAYIYANNKYLANYGSFFYSSILNLGYLKKGEEMTIGIDFNQDIDFDLDSIQLYGLNPDILAKTISTLKNQSMEDIKVTNTTVSGTVTATTNNEALFLSIPYDNSWKAYVNGKQVDISDFNSLMEIHLNKGTQTILLKFTPEGICLGIILTIIGLVGLLFIIIWEN